MTNKKKLPATLGARACGTHRTLATQPWNIRSGGGSDLGAQFAAFSINCAHSLFSHASAAHEMSFASELSRMLTDLGSSADEIAATLGGDKIQGVRNTVRFLNPIVRYCQRHLMVDNYAQQMSDRNRVVRARGEWHRGRNARNIRLRTELPRLPCVPSADEA